MRNVTSQVLLQNHEYIGIIGIIITYRKSTLISAWDISVVCDLEKFV